MRTLNLTRHRLLGFHWRGPNWAGVKHLGMAVVFLLSSTLPASMALSDDHVAGPLNGHFYELVGVEAGVNWYEAEALAAARTYNGLPGYLAAITTVEEQAFVTGAFPRIEPEYVWLGANDEDFEGIFRWITGEDFRYEAWDPGEPNGGAAENCLDFSDGSIGWNDERCDRPLDFYLVEYSAPILLTGNSVGRGSVEPVPDPTPVTVLPVVAMEEDCLSEPIPAIRLFEGIEVDLTDIPIYLNATAATDPDFEAFAEKATDTSPGEECYVGVFGLYFFDASGRFFFGSTGAFFPFELIDGRIDRVELLIGDQTEIRYDPEAQNFSLRSDFHLTIYGAIGGVDGVVIDIRPGDEINIVSPDLGVIPMAVLSTSLAAGEARDFDAVQVDPSTARFGRDGATVGMSSRNVEVVDVDEDGDSDLKLRFRAQDTGIVCADTMAEFHGATFDGAVVHGEDAVRTLFCDFDGTIRIKAHIDGRSQLVLRGDSARWHHFDYAAPGRHEFMNEPTVINNSSWFPVWPDFPDAENRDCRCLSDVFEGVASPLPTADFVEKVIPVQSRGDIRVVQRPTAENGYTLVIEFDDNPIPGSADYIVDVHYSDLP